MFTVSTHMGVPAENSAFSIYFSVRLCVDQSQLTSVTDHIFQQSPQTTPPSAFVTAPDLESTDTAWTKPQTKVFQNTREKQYGKTYGS